MELFSDVDIKSVVFGAAIAATCFIIGMNGYDFAYLFASVGLLYTGYNPVVYVVAMLVIVAIAVVAKRRV